MKKRRFRVDNDKEKKKRKEYDKKTKITNVETME